MFKGFDFLSTKNAGEGKALILFKKSFVTRYLFNSLNWNSRSFVSEVIRYGKPIKGIIYKIPTVFKCKQFYSMMISTKAKTPNSFKKLLADFNLSNPQDAFSIPYQSASETYVWSFQYRLLNFILFTNDKLFKIGLSDSDKCSFCGTYTEDLYHLFFICSSVRVFWNRFAVWWSDISGENLSLSLKDIIIGFLQRKDLLNYLIILGKIFIWEFRKNKIPPKLRLLLHKVEAKQEVEKVIAIKNRKLRDFYTRWELLL